MCFQVIHGFWRLPRALIELTERLSWHGSPRPLITHLFYSLSMYINRDTTLTHMATLPMLPLTYYRAGGAMSTDLRTSFRRCTRWCLEPAYQVRTYVVWSKKNISRYPHHNSLLICVIPCETNALCVSYAYTYSSIAEDGKCLILTCVCITWVYPHTRSVFKFLATNGTRCQSWENICFASPLPCVFFWFFLHVFFASLWMQYMKLVLAHCVFGCSCALSTMWMFVLLYFDICILLRTIGLSCPCIWNHEQGVLWGNSPHAACQWNAGTRFWVLNSIFWAQGVCFKCGESELAQKVYDEMVSKGTVEPDEVCHSALCDLRSCTRMNSRFQWVPVCAMDSHLERDDNYVLAVLV